HRAALLDPRFTVAGFAVMQDTDGLYYVTQDFIQPSGATPPPADPEPASPPPPPGDADPTSIATPVPAPERVPVAETVADTIPASSPAGEEPEVVEQSDPDATDPPINRSSELAFGEVAGLISESPASTPSARRFGPVTLAVLLLGLGVAGHGWSYTHGRRADRSTTAG
ncbi:MAG: CAP domain-containing protein, partial [Acidimicrobiales bacterium]